MCACVEASGERFCTLTAAAAQVARVRACGRRERERRKEGVITLIDKSLGLIREGKSG